MFIRKDDEHAKDISGIIDIKGRESTAIKTAYTTQMASHSVEELFSKGRKERLIQHFFHRLLVSLYFIYTTVVHSCTR